MAYIKKKSNDSYLITVSCGRDSNGKKISKSTTYHPELLTAKGNPKTEKTIEKDVNTFAAEFERNVLTGQYTEGYTMTFEKYSVKYLEEYAEFYQAPRTLQSTKATIDDFVNEFGYMVLESLSPLFLQQYANKLTKQKKKNGKPGTLSYNTIKRRLSVLSAMLSQAVRWNILSANPMDRVQIKKAQTTPGKQKIKFFTPDQANTFLELLHKPLFYRRSGYEYQNTDGVIARVDDFQTNRHIGLQIKFYFYLSMFTGCRRGELAALTWDDFDFEKLVVYITKSACSINGKIIIKETKTEGSLRPISLPSMVMDMARQLKASQSRYRLSIGTQWIGDNWVIIRWDGSMMGLNTPYQAFHRIINHYNATRGPEDPELPLIPLHGLRHTAATLLISYGVDIRTVSNRLGHSNTSTTLNIYSHALEELDRSASDTMLEVLSKRKA